MIVAVPCPSAPHPIGGVTALYEFANGLARRGHEVHLVHGAYFGCRIDRLDQLSWFRFEPDIVHHIVSGEALVGAAPEMPRADVVFATGLPSELGLPVLVVQGFEMLYPWIEREAFRTPCLKVCVANWLVDVGVQLGVAREQLRVVHMGIDHARFRPVRAGGSRPMQVGMLHSPHPAKGWAAGVAALEAVHQRVPDVRVVAFGTAEPQGPLPDWVTFRLDPGMDTLVRDVYGQSRVFLQPSDYEGFGFTAVEAMACGAALVTTDNGGSRDYALPDRTAAVVAPRDSAAMADAVVDLLVDDERRSRLAAAGERYVRRFDWDRAARELERHLEDYLADPVAFQQPPSPEDDAVELNQGALAARILGAPRTGAGATGGPSASRPAAQPTGGPAPPANARVEQGGAPACQGADADPHARPEDRRVTEERFVFNVVWTGTVFDHLALFTESLVQHTGARFRFVGNACPPEQLAKMERWASAHPDRVVEVIDVSSAAMLRHGDCLDAVLRCRDDGELFCFVDPDIFARGAFLEPFKALLVAHAAVTSGKELWSHDNVRPDGHPGVNGEYFFDRDGFVFGSPHLAIYHRDALDATIDRWGVGFSSAGNDIPREARDRIAEFGRDYWIYDTGKIVNILLQADGGSLVHQEHPDLIHIGGVSHYLAPPTAATSRGGAGRALWGEEPDWGKWEGMADRFAVARFTAMALRALEAGRQAPSVPGELTPHLQERLATLRDDLAVLVAAHSAVLGGAG